MWTLIVESGFAAWVTLFLTVAGAAAVVTVGRKRGRPGGVAASWAVAVLAAGALGFATGQRKVDQGIRGIPPESPNRVVMLSIGTREASANLLLAGMAGLLLCSIGGVLSLARPKDGATQTG
jgi:hypothetical protein